jgi:glycosyltransferase involved in cell wall biosynthesis
MCQNSKQLIKVTRAIVLLRANDCGADLGKANPVIRGMMRILHVITRSELGGAQAVVLAYLRSLRIRIDLALATGEEGFLTDEARALGVAVFVVPELVPKISPRLDWQAVRALNHVIREYKPDLVHAHSSKAGVIGRLAASLTKVPSVFTAHGFAFTENAGVRRRIIAIVGERIAASLGSAVIAVSDYDSDLAVRCRVLARNQVCVIHNGIADVSLRAAPAVGRQVNIAMVARFAAPKAHDCLLRALHGLQGNFNLWLIGDGPDIRQARADCARLGLSDRVVFMGARNDVPELLAKAHVFVLASNYEGLPISILEAMRAGLPVVASDVGGVCESVSDGENGFLVPCGDELTLRERLQRLVSSETLRAKLGAASRRRYVEEFTAERMVSKTLAVYEKALGCEHHHDTPRTVGTANSFGQTS